MSDTEAKETKRGRIRRLLVDPLTQHGFRRSKRMPEIAFQKSLAGMIDDLIYMSDGGLETLRDMLRSHGQGQHRDIWPSRATVTGFAEVVEPRPVAEMPALLRWFKSVEGPKAREEGTLVETYEFFQKYKRPPLHSVRAIRERAAENKRKLDLADDRIRRNAAREGDVEFVRRYRERLVYCESIVADGDAGREHSA